MRSFHFSLERVLWLRRLKEARARQTLARTLEEERGVLRDMERTQMQAADAAAELRAALGGLATGAAVRLHSEYAAALARRRARLAEARAQLARRVATDRGKLQESWRAREVVTRLRASALAEYRKAADREEQAVLDEVAGVRHARRAR